EELVADDEVVATVNETEIMGSKYNPAYRERKELENLSTGPDQEIDKEQIKEITLEGLIGQELINQEAKELGIEVTDEDIEEEKLMAEDEVVATINEKEIMGSKYNPAYRERKELENLSTGPDQEIDKEQIKEITLEGLIGQELINQEAKELGIEVTDEDIEEE